MSERICLNSPSSAICNGARRVVANDWLIVVLVALIATAVRWLFILYNPRVDGFLIYQGQPLSDGCTYILKALSIAQGHGIPPVQQPAIRPFYSMTLACLYTWFGFARWAVGVLNLVIGAFTAALIYLCGARALNRFCGVGAALFFAIDPSQLLQVPQAGTEPLGLLFFVASVYAALVAFETGRTVSYFLCGLFIGLSNITRTLTIFTLPFFLGLIVLLVGARRAWRAALIYALAMGLGAAVVISPWIWRQERTYGISSISDNIGEALYAQVQAMDATRSQGRRR
jgi:4-amino-4-deoxy-L-arabinose transferase-like glycosyltransferase